MKPLIGAFLLLGTCLAVALARPAQGAEPRWWKGNTHTHTLWSDGDGAPELACDRYREAGYHFLVLTDHHVLARGEKWFPVAEDGVVDGVTGLDRRLTRARVNELIERFGADTVELRDDPSPAMRLKTHVELQAMFDAPGEFLLIQGEEITGQVHVNGINLTEPISSTFEGDDASAIAEFVARVRADGEASGKPTLAHLNHPNYVWQVQPAEVLQIPGDFTFEVYNGHPAVGNQGNEQHASTEELWDMALTLRLGGLDRGLVYGVASDDTHRYHDVGPGQSNLGRGWVMVRSTELTADAITRAMQAGDYYSSTGVTLTDVRVEAGVYEVAIDAVEGHAYTTEFVGTMSGEEGVGAVGQVLLSTTTNPARYTFTGEEIYVRARVLSDQPMAQPDPDARVQMAWTQPATPAGAGAAAESR